MSSIALFNRLVNIACLGAHVLAVTVRARSLTFARLFFHAWRTPRRTPGVYRLPFGLLRYTDAESLMIAYEDIFVTRVYAAAGLPRAAHIVDCGANIGLSVIWFARTHPGATITAFEADPTIALALEANIKTMGLTGVTVVRAAVAEQGGVLGFVSDATMSGRVAPEGAAQVPAVRLSDYITAPVDLLKLDVEGSEFGVVRDLCLSGAIAHVQRLICEVHLQRTDDPRVPDLWHALLSAGFHVTMGRTAAECGLPLAAGGHVNEPTPFTAAPTAGAAFLLYCWRKETNR